MSEPAPPDIRDLEAGQIFDGFRLEASLNPGGMANLWRVTRSGDTLPMVMKIPLVHGSPVNIVGFEVEGMILPRLAGPHVPRFIKAGDFYRGRDAHYCAPPAQIRTCPIKAYGSHLG